MNRLVRLALCALLLCVGQSAAGAAEQPGFKGLTLREALEILESTGEVEIVFSERLVQPQMRVEESVEDGSTLEILDRLLRPHGLTTEAGPGGRRVVVPLPRSVIRGVVVESLGGTPLPDAEVRVGKRVDVAMSDENGRFELPEIPVGTYSLVATLPGLGEGRLEDVAVIEDSATEIEIAISISIIASESVVVSPSVLSVSRTEPRPVRTLASADIAGLPVPAGDYVRATEMLPGVSGGDFSARIHVRGGRDDEVLVLFDGVELLEPFHLKDFESALSIIPPRTVQRMDFLSGAFPASYGDRMSAVLDMTTTSPGSERASYLRASTLDSQLGTAGRLFEDRLGFMLSGRASTADPATDAADIVEDPRFWDLFAKTEADLANDQMLHLGLLEAHDDLKSAQVSELGVERVNTDYRSTTAWLTHHQLLGSAVRLETNLSVGRLFRDRYGMDDQSTLRFRVLDERELDVLGLRHEGAVQLTPRHSLLWGGEVRRIDADYDYSSESSVAPGETPRENRFDERVRGRQLALFLSGRLRLSDSLTLETGARFQENEIADDAHVSPRVSLAYSPGARSVIRLAWGHYYQSQRANELAVEDGETTFSVDERAEMAVAGYERLFGSGLSLRIEAYDKQITSPRVRFENLFDPVSRFPEVEADRVRIEPERADARGFEIFLRRRHERLDWWASYSYSRAEDRIDGATVPRAFDQPHAGQASLTYRPTSNWSIGLNGFFHTGWPTTAASLSQPDGGEPEVEVGPLREERLRDYERLDVRLTRSWKLGDGEIAVFADVLNVLGRENVRGFDYSVLGAPDDSWTLERRARHWLGTVPIIGFDWDF